MMVYTTMYNILGSIKMIVIIIVRNWLFLGDKQGLFGEVEWSPLNLWQSKRAQAAAQGSVREGAQQKYGSLILKRSPAGADLCISPLFQVPHNEGENEEMLFLNKKEESNHSNYKTMYVRDAESKWTTCQGPLQ